MKEKFKKDYYRVRDAINRFADYTIKTKIIINYKPTDKHIYLLLTPNYGNLGDQAIAFATIKFLQDNFPNRQLITVSLTDIYKYMRFLESHISPNDIVILQGGGNMGSLYSVVEIARQFIISHIKSCPIISFPTSIYYGKDAYSTRLLKRSQKIYSENSNLKLLIRDIKSYNTARKYYPSVNVELFPDMVLYLKPKKPEGAVRNNVLLCLRRDKEARVSQESRNEIIDAVFNVYPEAQFFDTQVTREIPDDQRKIEMRGLFNAFFCSKLVITDRLHGMILSAITGTPCVVINSSDGKVKATYEWIKNLSYISYVDDINPEKVIGESKKVTSMIDESKHTELRQYFDMLTQQFREL